MKKDDGVIVSEKYIWYPDNTVTDRLGRNKKQYSAHTTKIDIYEDRVSSWFLALAKKYSRRQNAYDYVALSVALAHIEGVEQFRRGDSSHKHSEDFFVDSAKDIFPVLGTHAAKRLYKGARCGLFHSGFTDLRIYLDYRYEAPVEYVEKKDRININVKRFVDTVEADFRTYIEELRAASKHDRVVKDFLVLWDRRWDRS